MIANNIALKDGDYPGIKNVSRMRNAIIAQRDFLQKGGQPQPSRNSPLRHQPPTRYNPPPQYEQFKLPSYHEDSQKISQHFESTHEHIQLDQYEAVEAEKNILADEDSLI